MFADTFIEDDDLYRFLVEALDNLVGTDHAKDLLPLKIPGLRQIEKRKKYLKGLADTLNRLHYGRLHYIYEGRTPWEVMRDHKMIANTRVDICSRALKRELLTKYRDLLFASHDTKVYMGLSWDEQDRADRLSARYLPWEYISPMTKPPYMQKAAMIKWLRVFCIHEPRLYTMGFPHNNCGGFCIKAGQAHFENLLRRRKPVYLYHEEEEREARKIVGDHSILRDRVGGKTRAMTLEEFRKRLEANGTFDEFDWGGCGCAVD